MHKNNYDIYFWIFFNNSVNNFVNKILFVTKTQSTWMHDGQALKSTFHSAEIRWLEMTINYIVAEN